VLPPAWPAGAAPVPVAAPLAGPLDTVSRTGRDLAVLAAVVVVLVLLVRVGSNVEYAVPVSLGNTPITNTDEVIADAEVAFRQHVDAQATRVADDAACYFFRPLGPTQGAVPAGMFPAGLLPGGEDADAIDLLLCGPVEMSTTAMDALPGMPSQPWLTGVVYYYEDDGPAPAFRGEFQRLLQSSLGVLTAASGGVKSDTLVAANGHSPDAGDIDDPDWRDVTPTGETPPGGLPGGGELPPGVSIPELPPGVSVPELPPGVTVPPGTSIPELPGLPELPGGGGG
jgi:hypothetical protein